MTGARRVVLALGSNLGSDPGSNPGSDDVGGGGRLAHLQAALDRLGADADIEVVAVSGVYETDPVGGPAEQPDYLNAVALLDVRLDPLALLERTQAVELALGRTRDVRWGPRTIDLDLVAVDDVVTGDPRRADGHLGDDQLVLPHPRARERAFVLVPWLDVDPAAELPGAGPVAGLLEALGAPGGGAGGVRRRDDLRLRGARERG